MRIAFASGKGGAGKTTVAASLAVVWPRPCLIVDADVEAPNLHLFLQPDLDAPQAVYLTVPELDAQKCTACGACADMCAYKAIAMLGGKPTIFADMCHGCGGCFEVCAPAALNRGQRELGSLQWGRWNLNSAREQALLMGKSRVGEAMSPPLLRALERAFASAACAGVTDGPDILIDSPPGVSCPAMTTARMAEALVLVAESTPFGMYDFKLAHAAFRKLDLPLAVVMNRAGMPGNQAGDAALARYCTAEGLPLLARLPFDIQAAEGYARGHLPPLGPGDNGRAWRERFERLQEALCRWIGGQPRPVLSVLADALQQSETAGQTGSDRSGTALRRTERSGGTACVK